MATTFVEVIGFFRSHDLTSLRCGDAIFPLRTHLREAPCRRRSSQPNPSIDRGHLKSQRRRPAIPAEVERSPLKAALKLWVVKTSTNVALYLLGVSEASTDHHR